jgi:hypothetical protein
MAKTGEIGVLAVFTGALALYSVLVENEFFAVINEITWETYYLSQIIFMILLIFCIGYAVALVLAGGSVQNLLRDLLGVGAEAKRFAKEQDLKRERKLKEVKQAKGIKEKVKVYLTLKKEESLKRIEAFQAIEHGSILPIIIHELDPVKMKLNIEKSEFQRAVLLLLVIIILCLIIAIYPQLLWFIWEVV